MTKSYLALRIVSVSLYCLATLVLLVGVFAGLFGSFGTHDGGSFVIAVGIAIGALVTAVVLVATGQLIALAIDIARATARMADAASPPQR